MQRRERDGDAEEQDLEDAEDHDGAERRIERPGHVGPKIAEEMGGEQQRCRRQSEALLADMVDSPSLDALDLCFGAVGRDAKYVTKPGS